ncbi:MULTISPECIES: hypothetical protein [Bacteria]|uniref:hypothetical protein n=1 Tax=Bacteria TaxID=2 RepID=UPI002E7B738C|nr:hypothetical protein [Cetobacterium somerae]WVJ03143.1 hypothetical protein VSU16_14560 [Cetobacterium somerae]
MEMINIKINKKLLDILEHLEKERISDKLQKKTSGTRNPIYIVEDCNYIDCLPEDADKALLIPYNSFEGYTLKQIHNGTLKKDFDLSDCLNDSLKDAMDLEEVKDILETSKESENLMYSRTTYQCLNWEEKAIFLNYKDASDYMKYQSHNLSPDSRIYVKSLGYDNRSVFPKFLDILENETLIERE